MTDVLPLLVFKEIKVEGFLVGRSVVNFFIGFELPCCTRWTDRWMEGVTAMAGWVNRSVDAGRLDSSVVSFARMAQWFV